MMQNKETKKKPVIGITGGIGCGKSEVMALLQEHFGAAVLLTDLIAHDLMKPGEVNYREICHAFGEEILCDDKTIDRKKLGALVFSEKEKLNLLNSITHPNVMIETRRRIEEYQKQEKYQLICLESALLFDTPLAEECDQIWYIYASEEIRIQRLMEGRGYTKEHCLRVIHKQLSEHDFRKRADVIIDNSGTVEDTYGQIQRILAK